MSISVFPQPTGFDPTRLTLRQTITSGSTITLPAGLSQVYAVLVGGAGGGGVGGPNNALFRDF